MDHLTLAMFDHIVITLRVSISQAISIYTQNKTVLKVIITVIAVGKTVVFYGYTVASLIVSLVYIRMY